MTKILYITNGITGSGGLERVLSIKTNELIENYDYQINILSLNEFDRKPFFEFNKQISHYNIEVSGNPLSSFVKYKNGLKKTFNLVNPDVVIVCDDGLKGFYIPLIIKKKCPIIYERHASIQLNFSREKNNLISSFKDKITYKLMRFGASKFDKFVVLTKGNLSEWNLKNIVVIPNPLSFYPLEKSTLNSKKIIAVGSHSYNKGYDMLLQVWKKITVIYPEWSLVVFGKIDSKKTFFNLAENLDLHPNIIFQEPVHDIKKHYLNSSIMVLPSRSEGFGMVLIEAMACGVPCISFDCPSGPKDIIDNEKDGFLVENGNIELFSQKIINLIEDENLRKEMGAKAKENVKRYLPEEIMHQWDKLFKELLQ